MLLQLHSDVYRLTCHQMINVALQWKELTRQCYQAVELLRLSLAPVNNPIQVALVYFEKRAHTEFDILVSHSSGVH